MGLNEGWISGKTLAQVLDIKLPTIRKWVRDINNPERIPYYKVGRLVRFKLSEVEAWMQNKAISPIQKGVLYEPQIQKPQFAKRHTN